MAKGTGSLQSVILRTLQIAGIVSLAVLAPNAIQILEQFGLTETRRKRLNYEIPKALKALERKKLILKTSHGYELTKMGRSALQVSLLKKPKPSKRWDGKWRLVIFDIPERKKYTRNRLRDLIGTYGFIELQRSVWVYPHSCENLVEVLKIDLSLGDELHYLVTNSFEGDSYLRDRFGIK